MIRAYHIIQIVKDVMEIMVKMDVTFCCANTSVQFLIMVRRV